MEFLAITEETLIKAAEVLRKGGIVAFPTETVYGLGADAYNPDALVKIFEAKGRPRFDPLIIHIADINTLNDVADISLLSEETKSKLYLLTEHFWPGPLSIVLPKSGKIPGIATSGLSTAAIRFPSHEAAQKLISLSTGAVAAPSANPFGSLSPTKAEHVRDKLGEKADIILDGGAVRIGVESTVLDITGSQIRILRHGGTPKEAIENLVGSVQDASDENHEVRNLAGGLASPGQLKSHYAPRTPLSVFDVDETLRLPFEKEAAYLFFDNKSRDRWLKEQDMTHNATVRVLSPQGCTSEAAACLFEVLHELDEAQVSKIFAQLAPQTGLGAAINDRLRRASA